MTTSGSYGFTVTRDDLITAALRTLQVYGIGDPIPPEVIDNSAQALNIFCKALDTDGLFLWCVQDLAIPMSAAQNQYSIGPLIGQPRPLRILDAYLRDNASGSDTTLTITSRYDYDTLGLKSAQGIPNQLYYDPQLGNGIVTLYNVPFDDSTTLHVVIQRPVQDFNLATDNPDFPQEAFQMLKWGLADEIGMEQGARDNVLDRVQQKAAFYRKQFVDSQQEQASVFFTPTLAGQYGSR